MKIGKRGIMNLEANKRLKDEFLRRGIVTCEFPACHSSYGLTWCHRRKRRYYNTVEELSDFEEVLLMCMKHHQGLEYKRDELEALFVKLRP